MLAQPCCENSVWWSAAGSPGELLLEQMPVLSHCIPKAGRNTHPASSPVRYCCYPPACEGAHISPVSLILHHQCFSLSLIHLIKKPLDPRLIDMGSNDRPQDLMKLFQINSRLCSVCCTSFVVQYCGKSISEMLQVLRTQFLCRADSICFITAESKDLFKGVYASRFIDVWWF